MRVTYGLDLGTTFTKCALFEGDSRLTVFDLDVEFGADATDVKTRLKGLRSAVTVAGVAGNRIAYVGSQAIKMREELEKKKLPYRAFEEAKLWIGTDFSQSQAVEAPPWRFDEHSYEYRPEDVGALVLRAVAREVERVGRPRPEHLVITHPAQFDSTQQHATRHAAALAGMAVVDLLTEPEAAAIAYSREIRQDGLYVIFDLGGGTLDIVLVAIKNRQFRTVRKDGTKIGGRDFDRAVLDAMMHAFDIYSRGEFRSDMLGPVGELLWLAHAERVKRRLNEGSSADLGRELQFEIPFDSTYALEAGLRTELLPDSFPFKMSLLDFDRHVEERVTGTRELVEKLLSDEGVAWDSIQGVISVGGSTKLQAVKRMLDEVSKGKVLRNLDPDTVVAQGAAIHAASLSRQGGQASVVGELIKKTPYRGTLFRSVGLRIETADGTGRLIPLVKKGVITPLDVPVEKTCSTSQPNQDHILIQLYEGESPDPEDSDNNFIGECRIEGFPPTPGLQKVVVRLQIEGNDTKRITVKLGAFEKEVPIEFDPRKVLDRPQVEARRVFLEGLKVQTGC